MHLSRRGFLGAAAAVAVVPAAAQAAHSAPSGRGDPLPLVTDGRARAMVVRAADADDQVRHAADLLAEMIERATGVRLPVGTEAPTDGRTAVFVGQHVQAPPVDEDTVAGLGDDGYVLHRAGGQIAILGASSWGTRYGVYEFLERQVDVRWLMPDAWPGFAGLVGSDVPETSTLDVELSSPVVEQPAFTERVLHPLPIPNPAGQEWDYPGPGNRPAYAPMMTSFAQPNRLRHQIDFQHNLWDVIAPSLFGDPAKPGTYHPEFFPIINGETYVPAPDERTGWQPRFSAPGIAKAAATRIGEIVAATGATSISLSVNDGGGYSEDDLDPAAPNHFNMPSASAAYYGFVSRVATILADEVPDLRIGLIAYTQVADPPAEPLPDNVVPFLTRDTSSWLDPVRWARDDLWVQDWRRAATHLGWWDYAYGRPYNVPHLYLQHLADSYRYLRDNDVRAIMAETRLPLGEGPTMWIFSKLLWNPDANVRRLLVEWCRRTVGPRAAPFVASYFRHWEQFWTERVPESEWFDSPYRIWTAFRSAAYLEIVTPEDMTKSRRWLEQALDRVQTPEQRVRMEALFAHFEFYEACALSFPRRTTFPADTATAQELLASTTAGLDESIDYAAARLESATILYEGLGNYGPERYNLVWSGWNLFAVWDIAHYIAERESSNGSVRGEVERLAVDADSESVRRFAQMVLALADGQVMHLGTNTSFEAETLQPWSVPTESGIAPDREVVRDGEQSMLIPAGFYGRITQEVSAQPGFFRFAASLHTPAGQEDSAQDPEPLPPYGYYCCLRARVKNAEGTIIQQLERQFSLKKAAGDWYEVVLSDLLDAGAASVDCWIIVENNPPVWVDAVSITQLRDRDLDDPWQPVFTDTFDDGTAGEVPATFSDITPGALTLVPAAGRGLVAQLSGVGPRTENESATRAFGPVAGDVLVTYLVRNDVGRIGVQLDLEDEEGGRLLRIAMSGGGTFRYSDGDGPTVNTNIEYTADQWYRVDLVLHALTGSYDFSLDGEKIGAGALSEGGAPAQLRVSTNNGMSDGEAALSLDGVSVQTPAG